MQGDKQQTGTMDKCKTCTNLVALISGNYDIAISSVMKAITLIAYMSTYHIEYSLKIPLKVQSPEVCAKL